MIVTCPSCGKRREMSWPRGFGSTRAYCDRCRGICVTCGRRSERLCRGLCGTCYYHAVTRTRTGAQSVNSEDFRATKRDLWIDRFGPVYWQDPDRGRERIIAAIRAFARRKGRPPTAREWQKPVQGRGGRSRIGPRSARRPPTRIVQRVFGTWNAAIEAAGFTPRGLGQAGHMPRTHCRRGHEFTPENTRVRPGGNRECRACKNAAARARRKRQSTAAGRP